VTETGLLLWGTVVHRPYVYAFFAVFAVFAVHQLGAARAATFAATTWLLAFGAEYSSTRNGFPFGFYRYFDETRGRELWISNVPFWDSLSFVFLSYFSFALAAALLSPPEARARGRWPGLARPAAPLLGGVLMMLLDVVIDPVALQGEKWFLGRIYEYPHRGFYFGVTAANFAGWFLVGAASQWAFQRAVAWLPWCGAPWRRLHPRFAWLVLAVYAAVFLFNLAVTIAIGDGALALASAAVIAGTVGIAASRLRAPRRGAVVVCAATGAEAAACRRGIAEARVDGIEVLATGVGAARAAEALRARLADGPRPSLVVSSGFAGALSPGLEVGSFVTAGALYDAGEGRPPARVPLPPGLLRLAPAGTRVALLTAGGVASGAALPPPAAADMESAALARVAAAEGVRFAVYRLVSDAPGAPLPSVARSVAAALAVRGLAARAAAAARVARDVARAPREAAGLVRGGLAWGRALRRGWREHARELAGELPAADATGREVAGG
jgi:putative membrane protein